MDDLDTPAPEVPALSALAEARPTLPPLHALQSQAGDHVNPPKKKGSSLRMSLRVRMTSMLVFLLSMRVLRFQQKMK